MALKVMLAASEIPKLDSLQLPLYGSFKLDGIRSPIVEGQPMSRKMLVIPNLHYRSWVASNKQYLTGIDCEVISGEPSGAGVFQRTTSAIMSVHGQPHFHLYVFDAWASPHIAEVRQQQLLAWHANLPDSVQQMTTVLEQRLLTTIEDVQKMMDEALDLGYEGLILRHPKKKYKNGRSTLNESILLKLKEFADDEATVIAVLQGMTNTNPLMKDELGHAKRSTAKAGMVPTDLCGGFLAHSEKFGEITVGLGHQTMAEAKAMWANRESLVSRPFVYTYQPYGVLKLPRFPSFKGWRHPNDIGEPA